MPEKFYKIFLSHIIVASFLNTSIFTVPVHAGEKVKCVSEPKRESFRKSFGMEDGYGRNVYRNERAKSEPEGQRHIGIKAVNAAR